LLSIKLAGKKLGAENAAGDDKINGVAYGSDSKREGELALK
jgi:hypothetical protein